MLRYALYDTPCWRSFITDLLYDIGDTDSRVVLTKYKKKSDNDKRGYIERIREIRTEINKDAIIIAVGSDAYELLLKGFNDEERKCLKKITHFSFKYLSIESYRSVVKTQIESDKSIKHITMKTVNDLPDISSVKFEDVVERFDKEQEANENAVSRCFEVLGDDCRDVLIKTIVLNNRYSAGLTDHPKKILLGQNNPVDVITMATFITNHKSEIDSCVNDEKTEDLIKLMRNIGNEYVSPYSFVTKYCAWQYPNLKV